MVQRLLTWLWWLTAGPIALTLTVAPALGSLPAGLAVVAITGVVVVLAAR